VMMVYIWWFFEQQEGMENVKFEISFFFKSTKLNLKTY